MTAQTVLPSPENAQSQPIIDLNKPLRQGTVIVPLCSLERAQKLSQRIALLKSSGEKVARAEEKAFRKILNVLSGKERTDKLSGNRTQNVEKMMVMARRLNIFASVYELYDGSHFLIPSEGFDLVISWQHAEWLPIIKEISDVYLLPKRNDTVIDVGAHYGFYTLPAARLTGDKGLVIAIEPQSQNFRGLTANLQLNGIRNAKPLRMGLGDSDGNARLWLGGHPAQHSLVNGGNSRRYELVPIRKLDTIVNELKLNKVDLIKVDTEGFELNILNGAISTIQKHRPRLTIASYHYATESKIIVEWLKENAPFYHVIKTRSPKEGDIIHAL